MEEICKNCIRYKTSECEGDKYCPHFCSATSVDDEKTIADIKMSRFRKKEMRSNE